MNAQNLNRELSKKLKKAEENKQAMNRSFWMLKAWSVERIEDMTDPF